VPVCHLCLADLPNNARFCIQCGTAVPDTALPAMEHGERRQLTVVFADLADFTHQATHLDPEDLQAFLGAYHVACREAVEAYGGIVAEYLGDGIVAYFGYPTAREDAARQAIRAGLRIVQRATKIEPANRRPTQVRVGIATGVVVTQPKRSLDHGPRIIGEVPTLAARLQSVAPLNGVIVGDLTRRLAGDIFHYSERMPQNLKGFTTPVDAWQVYSERTEPQGTMSAAPLAGRASTLARLSALWQEAERGETAAVLIVGDPGIGKSRLTREFRASLPAAAQRPAIRVDSDEQNAPFLPLRQWILRVAHLEGMDDGNRFDHLSRALRAVCPGISDADLSLLGSLAGVAAPQSTASNLVPQRWRAEVQRALAGLIAGMAADRPFCLLCEDLHWLDTSSLELLETLLKDGKGRGLLLVLTSRPAAEALARIADWNVERVTLDRLDDIDSAALVNAIAGNRLNDELKAVVVERADGVPLFLEELARTLLEARAAGSPQQSDQVPSTLLDSLTTRLDRTGHAKQLAQLGAVIGRNFNVNVAAAISDTDQRMMEEQAGVLREAGLIVPDTAGTYAFRHALIRDAAYATLLHSRRRELHGQLAQWLVDNDSSARPEEIARHFTSADKVLDAASYWRQAGEMAAGQAAFIDAETHFRHAIMLLESQSDKGAYVESLRSGLLASLGATLMQTRGFAGPEVHQTYQQAYQIAARHGGAPAQLIPVLWGFFIHQMIVGKVDAAVKIAEELRAIAANANDPDLKLIAEVAVGGACFYSGNFRCLIAQNDYVRVHYDQKHHRPFAAAYGMDLLNQGLLFEAHARWILGEADQVSTLIAEADRNGALLELPLMVPYTEIWGAAALIYAGELSEAIDRLERGIALADQQGFLFWSITGRVWRAIAALEADDLQTGLPLLTENRAVLENIGTGIGMPFFMAVQAHALARADKVADAVPLALQAAVQSDETGDGCWRAEVLRLYGEVLAAAGNYSGAQQAFAKSMAFAAAQGAVAWQLRTAISRARHAAPDDDPHAMSALLTLVHDAGPGVATRDLSAARLMTAGAT
jgi:class 3 adenylate cyclase